MRPARCHRGFTLLEVLVALAILALSAAAVLRQTHLNLQQQQALELKSSALWIADDALALTLAEAQWPPIGRSERELAFAGQSWRVMTDVQATPDSTMRKIEVSVVLGTQADNAAPLMTLTAYRGQY